MFWQQRPNSENHIDQISHFTDFNNKLTEEELHYAFINLANLYARDFFNLKLLEDALVETYGKDGDANIEKTITETPTGLE